MDENEVSELLERLVKMAAENQNTVHDTKALRRLIDDNDLVFGVWNDPVAPHGVGRYIIKGEGDLDTIIYARTPQQMKVTAVACRNIEDALAMREVFGDMSKAQ